MKNKVNGIFRKVCNILEWIISAILVVVVAVMCVRFVFDLGGMFDSAPVEFFETFVADIMTLAVGVELIKMLSQHTPATVVEVLMFAIAREMVTHHDSALNTALGVLSVSYTHLDVYKRQVLYSITLYRLRREQVWQLYLKVVSQEMYIILQHF